MQAEKLEGGEHLYLPGVIDVPTVLVPPDTPPRDLPPFEERVAWVGDPDDDGLVCTPAEPGGPGRASPDEIAECLARLAESERVIDALHEEETGLSTGREDIDHLDFDEEWSSRFLGPAHAGHQAVAPWSPVIAALLLLTQSRSGKRSARFKAPGRRLYFPRDEVYTTNRLAGAACWMPPGRTRVSALEQVRMLPGMIASGGRDLGRLLALLNAFEKRHPHEKEHWYLPVVAVKPEWQGRGFGAALLRPVLDRCDRDGVPAYLEATSPRNRALYERHQFVVVDELRVRPGAPPAWPMWREPQPKQSL